MPEPLTGSGSVERSPLQPILGGGPPVAVPPTARSVSSIAVAVVNFNTREHLRACLASVFAQSPARVVVADNASTDGSVEMVRRCYPEAILRANPGNPGFGAAANQAIAACGTDYVLLLNSDTVLQPGAIRELRSYLDHHPRAAIVGPRLSNPDGSPQASCFPFPGTLRWLLENDPVAFVARHVPLLRTGSLRFSPPERARVVPWVLGAAFAIRRMAWDEVGGFDESFFMYYEEVDVCLRLSRAGWETHFTPSATITHVGGASTSQRRTEMAVQHFASTLQFYRRHYSGLRLAAWLTIMRAKVSYRLLRDSVRARTASGDRDRVRDHVVAWRRALLEK